MWAHYLNDPVLESKDEDKGKGDSMKALTDSARRLGQPLLRMMNRDPAWGDWEKWVQGEVARQLPKV